MTGHNYAKNIEKYADIIKDITKRKECQEAGHRVAGYDHGR